MPSFAGCARLELGNATISRTLQRSLHAIKRFSLSSPFSHLESLGIYVDNPAQWSTLFTRAVLPALVSLLVHCSAGSFDRMTVEERLAFAAALERLAPRLTNLGVGGRAIVGFLTQTRTWLLFPALQHLAVAGQYVDRVLDQLPTQLDTIKIVCLEYPVWIAAREMGRLQGAIERGVRSVSALKQVAVATAPARRRNDRGKPERAKSQLAAVCEARGIAVIFTEGTWSKKSGSRWAVVAGLFCDRERLYAPGWQPQPG